MIELPHPALGPWTPVPAEFADRYRRRGYWTGQTFADLLADSVSRFSDRTAVVDAENRWSYEELGTRAERVAAGLLAAGVRYGDRVIVQLPNVAGYVSALFGIWRIGALPVFALPAHRESELRHFCLTAGATAIVTTATIAGHDHLAMARRVADALPQATLVLTLDDLDSWGRGAPSATCHPTPADQPAFLQLSGGTTGTPKLIPRTSDDYLYSVRESARICELTERDVMLVVLPAAHNFSMSSPGILGALYTGGTVVMCPDPSAATGLGLVAAERVTVTALVPPFAMLWMSAAARSRADTSSLRLVQVGGAKFAAEAAARLETELGGTLQQVFGMAEGLVNYTRPDDDRELTIRTQGRPLSPDDEVRVVDAEGNELPDGVAGELLTRGPYTIRGYLDAADHNAVAFTADGFYRTGDLVRRWPSGHLEVVGRVKDQINRGGEKIASEEVENHLLAHPGVLDAIVVGAPDPYLGERTCAFVIPRVDSEPPDTRQLREFLLGRGLAHYKVPDRVHLVDAFPSTGVGKTSRRELRRLLTHALATPADPPPTTADSPPAATTEGA